MICWIKYFIYIILINIICNIVLYIYSKFKHPFWSKSPVSQYYQPFNKIGIITYYSDPENDKTDMDKPFSWHHFSSLEDMTLLCKLLNDNYLIDDKHQYYYTLPFIQFILNTPYKHYPSLKNTDRKLWQVLLKHNNEIIGSNTTRPLKLKIGDNICHSFYVDLLCIKKEFRGKHISPKLILKMKPAILDINQSNKHDFGTFNMFIFKKDHISLPFNCVCSYKYYYLELDKYDIIEQNENIIELTEEYLFETFTFFKKHIERFKLYRIYTVEEFSYIFLNDFVHCYIKIDDNNCIIGMISYYNSQFINKQNKRKSYELLYSIKDENYELIQFILNKMKEQNTEFLFCTNIMDNARYINKYNFTYTNTSYYHLYNYHYPKITAKECALCIL